MLALFSFNCKFMLNRLLFCISVHGCNNRSTNHSSGITMMVREKYLNDGFIVWAKNFSFLKNDHITHIDEGVYSWLLRFSDYISETAFRDTFGQCMYETLNEVNFAKAK